MGAYSGVGAYLSKWVLGEGAYSGGGVIREWGLIRSFTVCEFFIRHDAFFDRTHLFLTCAQHAPKKEQNSRSHNS